MRSICLLGVQVAVEAEGWLVKLSIIIKINNMDQNQSITIF